MVQLGTLYGISVGPGDPELLTLKGLRLLKNAAVVAFPSGINGKPGIAQQIVAQWLHPEQVQLSLHFPYVQDLAELTQAWQTAADQVWVYLQQGQDVAFVCEGDVSFYSTFTYLAQTLQQCYPSAQVEAIPGVCSPLAAAASLGIPLSLRAQKIAVLPAFYNVEELEAAVQWAEVIVLLKVSSVYSQVWQILQTRQLLDRSYVVEWATTPKQMIHKDLRDRPHLDLSYFSLLIVQVSESNDCNER
jgi:precorrin-2/cobalt-factor-2 C20-methyltransferase